MVRSVESGSRQLASWQPRRPRWPSKIAPPLSLCKPFASTTLAPNPSTSSKHQPTKNSPLFLNRHHGESRSSSSSLSSARRFRGQAHESSGVRHQLFEIQPSAALRCEILISMSSRANTNSRFSPLIFSTPPRPRTLYPPTPRNSTSTNQCPVRPASTSSRPSCLPHAHSSWMSSAPAASPSPLSSRTQTQSSSARAARRSCKSKFSRLG